MDGTIKKLATILLFGFGLITIVPATAQAQNQVCDPEFMETLKQRAWMQAQREIEINANLINKPDSVFVLTCFDQFLNHAANFYIFESDAISAENVMNIPLISVMANNGGQTFGHIGNGFQFSLLGGSFQGSGVTVQHLNSSVSAGVYGACKKMESVWQAVLQNTNIGAPPNEADDEADYGALFPDLEDYVSSEDTRRVPKESPALPPDTQSGWQNALDRMKTLQQAQQIQNGIGSQSCENDGECPDNAVCINNQCQQSYFDAVRLFREKWAPENEVGCSDGIPTGVAVNPSSGAEYDEKICPNPGCYFTGGTNGSCEPI